MNILIKIKSGAVEIILMDKDKILDSLKIVDEYQLSERLLISIDTILKRNKIKLEEIEKVDLDSDMQDSFTTHRIAKITADTFNFAKSF